MAEPKVASVSPPSPDRQLASALATAAALRSQLASKEVICLAFECDDAARMIADEHGRIVECNRMAEHLFGDVRDDRISVRVFERIQRRHGRRRSEQSVVHELPVAYGVELLTRLQSGKLQRIRERVVIDSRMKGLIGAILSVVPLDHGGKRWLKIEVNEVDSIEDDNLTRLGTKEQLERKVAEAIQSEATFSLLYFDIDKFKPINDEHGHADGDDVIAGVAERTSNCAQRSTDFPARLHGDEFCVLVLDNVLAACGLGERIRAEIEGNPFMTRSGNQLSVTISMGAAEYEPGDTVDALIKRADANMIAAKREGRNRISTRSAVLKRP
ncbi:MAG: GGDEF domain-containing protein [Patescibacteria group bacterium]|nr:MAG: GGDEF domain-containing protein [Patescibacteria group bacterium]